MRAVAALPVVLAACAGAPEPRVWLASALFFAGDAGASAVAVDTTAPLPAAAQATLEAAGIALVDSTSVREPVVRFGAVRALGGSSHEVEAVTTRAGAATRWRLTVRCTSRHCLVIDTTRIAGLPNPRLTRSGSPRSG